MKKFYTTKKYTLSIILFLAFQCLVAQVGINTTNPEGILDIQSNNYGVVLPRISLTSTQSQSPVQNPQGGTLEVGTVVYNNNTTTTGTNDVVPGIYVWTGSEWLAKFTKKDVAFYTQSNFLRPQSSAGVENIPGLTSQTFTARFTGTYKIEVNVNYGGGILEDIDGNPSLTDVATQSGDFFFDFDGDVETLPAKSYSVQGSTNYYLIWEQYSKIMYVELVSGQTYNFNLSFDQDPSPEFVNNGNFNPSLGFYEQGTGYIGFDVPCGVEITYIDAN